jgi:predicted mannosyl-3-phosphoglycerate phosphatase (HAD superfamily)
VCQCGTVPSPAAADPPVRIVYSDLDGTMVGPGGCFFLTADRTLTITPAQALLDLHTAGVQLVLVSGRSREQLVEAAAVFGADGFIGEVGSVIGWDRGRRFEVLRGAMPAGLDGPPVQVLGELGIVDALMGRYPGHLEYHAPWHEGHLGDVMLRGLVDTVEVESWLAGQGLGWLRLRDNGVLPHDRGERLAASARPPHVYHLMPDGLSKGSAVAADLARRGLSPRDAVAIGDSLSDLDMAPTVRRMFIVANGHRHVHMAGALAAVGNVTRTVGALGLGWAEAVHDALGTAASRTAATIPP